MNTLSRQLNNAGPAFKHASLGDLINEMISAHNSVAATVPSVKMVKVNLGSPTVPVADALIKAATGGELPNNETVVYDGTTGTGSPQDGGLIPTTIQMADGTFYIVCVLDVPRNIWVQVKHASTTILMTLSVDGFDVYKNRLSEQITLTGSVSTGAYVDFPMKKAFKYISDIAITSSLNAEANTVNVGYGDVLGLPYVLTENSDLMYTFFNQVKAAATVVVADKTSPATNVTGDPRGTIDTTASNGSPISVWMNTAQNFGNDNAVLLLSER